MKCTSLQCCLILSRYAAYPAVITYHEDNWSECAPHWAFFGRKDASAMDVNTNNHLERWNGTLKYVFLLRKKVRMLSKLLSELVTEVMPHYIYDRLKKLAGLESSGMLPLFSCLADFMCVWVRRSSNHKRLQL